MLPTQGTWSQGKQNFSKVSARFKFYLIMILPSKLLGMRKWYLFLETCGMLLCNKADALKLIRNKFFLNKLISQQLGKSHAHIPKHWSTETYASEAALSTGINNFFLTRHKYLFHTIGGHFSRNIVPSKDFSSKALRKWNRDKPLKLFGMFKLYFLFYFSLPGPKIRHLWSNKQMLANTPNNKA